MFGFKEVCFVAGGVDFLSSLRYSHSLISIFYHTQFRELNKKVTTFNNDVKNWTMSNDDFRFLFC